MLKQVSLDFLGQVAPSDTRIPARFLEKVSVLVSGMTDIRVLTTKKNNVWLRQ